MLEVPDNAPMEYMMDFKKFAQSVKGLIYTEEKVFIKGVFKWANGETTKEDNFWAKAVHTSGKSINAKEIYKTYLEWFNRTLRPYEQKRFFVSAKIDKIRSEEETKCHP